MYEHRDFVLDPIVDRKEVKLLKVRSDVLPPVLAIDPENEANGGGLHFLKRIELCCSKTTILP